MDWLVLFSVLFGVLVPGGIILFLFMMIVRLQNTLNRQGEKLDRILEIMGEIAEEYPDNNPFVKHLVEKNKRENSEL